MPPHFRRLLPRPNPKPSLPSPSKPPSPVRTTMSSSSSSSVPWPPMTEEERREWAELPRDALATVLGKLGQAEILEGACRVCRSCRRAAANEPALWRRSEARSQAGLAVARLAVRLPSLKSLHLISCHSIFSEGFIEAIKKFPLLEKLEISHCRNIFGEATEAVGKACPHLKHFRLSKDYSIWAVSGSNKDQDAQGISTMRELRSLQLCGNDLTNKGLAAILDNCPHLEFLDIRQCFNVNMDAAMRAKCARIKTLRRPHELPDEFLAMTSPTKMME